MDRVIYIDRLRNGESQEFSGQCTAEEIGLGDMELRFAEPIQFKIRAYATDDHALIHMNLSTIAELPCKICNEWTQIKINFETPAHATPLSEIRSRVYDFTPLLIENIVLELPQFTECQGNCPERDALKSFLINS
ncbi:MAG: hypothetical protein ChlgKO_11340 [Chlamydiales bacterium]